MADLTLDQLRQLKGGDRVVVSWREAWGLEPERTYGLMWRGGLLWAVNGHGTAERVLCWSAEAKPTEELRHKVRRAP